MRSGWIVTVLAASFLLCISVLACASSEAPGSTVTAGPQAVAGSTPAPTASIAPALDPTLGPTPTGALQPAPSTEMPTAPAPTPPPTEEAGSGPVIRYFRATVNEAATGSSVVYQWEDVWPPPAVKAAPGDTILFEWESEGAATAVLKRHYSDEWLVGVTGAFTYEVRPDDMGCVLFELSVVDTLEQSVFATFHLLLPCPEPMFFSPAQIPACCGTCRNYGCPDPAFDSAAAEQHFEHGTMVWVKEQDSIYVLFEDVPSGSERACRSFLDEWDEDQPDRDPDIVPPPDLYQPVRGFGLVWRQNPEVRERLGWATDQEAGFTTTVQWVPSAGRHSSYYLRALDGNVWHVYSMGTGCGWGKIQVED